MGDCPSAPRPDIAMILGKRTARYDAINLAIHRGLWSSWARQLDEHDELSVNVKRRLFKKIRRKNDD